MLSTNGNQTKIDFDDLFQAAYQRIAAKKHIGHHDAEDAAANGILALLERDEPPDRPMGFTIKSANNKAVDHVRREIRNRTFQTKNTTSLEADTSVDPVAMAIASERRSILRDVLFSLDIHEIVDWVSAAHRISEVTLKPTLVALGKRSGYYRRNKTIQKVRGLLSQKDL